MQDDALFDIARAWLSQDPDPGTARELDDLLSAAEGGDASALEDLRSRFTGRLAFGTAGLRGELGAGPQRMNRVLVAQAAAGLARYLKDRTPSPSVVIGYDGRTQSDEFARDTAEIMAAAGVRAILLPRRTPTPVLAFAVRHLNTSAGVMVTASHNPRRDNGYKVYLGDSDGGSQIVPPSDQHIAAYIDEVAASERVDQLPRSGDYVIADESVLDAYVAATARLKKARPAELKVVYTAMHGVGWETFQRVLAAAGYPEPVVVAEQRDPDGSFPTAPFPNPEEPGTLDLAFALAREHHADLILAHDPDADRLAVAIPEGDGYRRLTGNEVGWLLGWHVAERVSREKRTGTLACSIVSSPALAQVAAHYGMDSVTTLTGFKWVSRAPGILFGYEEALGYLVNPETVRDKDGISAALAFLDLASELAATGRTVGDRLNEFAATFGRYASSQVSLRVTDVSTIAEIMAGLRAQPPAEIGGIAVTAAHDYLPEGSPFPNSDILVYELVDGSRVMVRPSGTEPKLKVYLDAVGTGQTAAERDEQAAARIANLERAARVLIGMSG